MQRTFRSALHLKGSKMEHQETYGHMEIHADVVTHIRLLSTVPELLDWVKATAKNILPSSEARKHKNELFSDFSLEFQGLPSPDYSVPWWNAKQICQQGWEPLEGDLWHSGRLNLRMRFVP